MYLITKIVLVFTVLLFVGGCTSFYPPPNKAGLLVTSPPHQLFLITDTSELTPELIEMCVRNTNAVKFKDYKFNESMKVATESIGTSSDTRTYSNSLSIKGRK